MVAAAVKHEPRRQHERCPIRCAQRPSWTRARDRSVCNNLLSRSAVATVLQSPVPRQRRFAGYERLGGVARRGSEQLRRGTTTHTVLATPARSATRLKAIDIVRRIGPGLLDATWSLGQLLPPQIGCWRPLPEHPRISPHSWHATVEAKFEPPQRKCSCRWRLSPPTYQRKEWDLNPRSPRGDNGFRDRPIRPLWHPSAGQAIGAGIHQPTGFSAVVAPRVICGARQRSSSAVRPTRQPTRRASLRRCGSTADRRRRCTASTSPRPSDRRRRTRVGRCGR